MHVPYLVLAAVLAILAFAGLWRVRAPARNAARARAMGAKGESAARALLKKKGYRILIEQPAGQLRTEVDGALVVHHVRADFLVERRGRRYIADAKAGPLATRSTRASTRRQFLEYTLAYRVPEVLLIDTSAGAIRRVRFVPRPTPPWRWLVLGVCLGALGSALAYQFYLVAGDG